MSPDGMLSSFEAAGHAGTVRRGANLACAAATALLRTAGRICEDKGIVVGSGPDRRGTMRCLVKPIGAADADWLRGVTAFLVRGLRDLRDEFPDDVDVEVAESSPGATGRMSPGATARMSPGATAED
jgi:uncharacterized protein YsxB (DUF464 family)